MPDNPNSETPHRTAPATQGNPAQEGMDAARQDDAIASLLSNPQTQAAVAELFQKMKWTLADAKVTQGIWGWPEGEESATIELSNGEEYMVTPDEDTTNRLARAMVLNDLRESPENFNAGFIERYINLDRVRDALRPDVEEMARDDAFERGLTNAEGEFDEDAISKEAEETLKDPIAYLQETFGKEEGLKQAIQFGGINEEEAAEDAVAADGEGHFVSSYDGKVLDLPHGGQYWRHN
jgi:hypothetical protein